MLKINFLITLGTVIEAFDTFLFVLLFPVFSPLFLNDSDSELRTLSITYVFLLQYFCKFIGALIFGHFGDRIGRCVSLSSSIVVISAMNLFIALLPSYASIGIIAPILLILFRVIQAICYAGEVSGAVVYLVENASYQELNKKASLTNLAVLIGGILAKTLSFSILSKTENIYLWRLAFFISACFGIIGYYFRRGLYRNSYEPTIKKLAVKWPILLLLQKYKLSFIIVIILSNLILLPFLSVFYYIPCTFPSISRTVEDLGLMIVSIPVLLFMSFCADRLGLNKILLISNLIFIIFIYYIQVSNNEIRFIIKSLLFWIWAASAGPINVIAINLFPTNIRYTAVSLSCACGTVLSALLVPYMWDSSSMYLKYIPLCMIAIAYILSFYAVKLISTTSKNVV